MRRLQTEHLSWLIFLFILQNSIMPKTILGACSTAGEQRYSASTMQYCDGSKWQDMKGLAVGSCTATAGTLRYNSNQFEFCDGTNWYPMKGERLTACANAGE